MSRNGIVYDLRRTPYVVEVNGIEFFFSSRNLQRKFENRMDENRDILRYSLRKRFGIDIRIDTYFDIILYNKIESRGFLIKTQEGENIECLDQVLYVGGNKIERR